MADDAGRDPERDISPDVVPDEGLRAWMATGGPGTRELIVEAAIPRVQVHLEFRGQEPLVGKVDGSGREEREHVLQELVQFAEGVLSQPPSVLAAAGAIAVRATPEQARALAQSPLVRAIRPNRVLRTK